jgi:molecular chaperone DnaK (HSP70)
VFFEYLISEANKTLADWYSENTYVDKVILSKPNLTVNYQAEIKKIVESINIKNSNRKIEVIAVLDEAVSVAVNKFDDISTGDERNILVVDIGGGTTDISGVKYDGKQFSVIANSGIDNAGSWLDDNIYRYLLKKSNVNPTNNERLKLRNLEECRAAKELVENFNQRNFQIFDSNNIKRDVILTHKEYEEILLKFYQQVEMLLSKTINECKVKKMDLEYVIYAGGTCSSNMLRGLINSKFNLMDISYNEDFKVATAKGNARYVNMNNDLHNIINYSFGVDMMSRCNGELTAGIENLIFKGGLLLK